MSGTLDFTFDIQVIWPNILLMTVLYAFGNIFIFKSLQLGSASSFSVYFSLRVFVNLVISYFFFSQSFSVLSFIGLILLLSGIIIVDYSPEIWKISKSELYALLSALCIGITNGNSQVLLSKMSLSTYLVLSFILPAVFMIIIYPQKSLKMKMYLRNEYFSRFSILAVLYTLASIYFFKAIQDSNDSALVTAIGLSSIVVTVIFSFILLKERKHFWRKLFAAVITFGGLLLLV